MSPKRIEMELTPHGRLAVIARAEIYKHYDTTGTPRLPDYADLREALEAQTSMELLNARLAEARMKPANEDRIKVLLVELGELHDKFQI